MIKVTKAYTIKFSKAGICQYAYFSEDSDGNIVHPSFHPRYCNSSEIPSLDGLKTIEEILKVIKDFSFCKRAEIYLINGMPVGVYKNKKAIKHVESFESRLESFLEKEAISFFEKVLEPIMKKNKWFISASYMIGMPVLIAKDENNEWDNIPSGKKEEEFEYLCYKFVSCLGKGEATLESESYNRVNGFAYLCGYIPTEYFIEKKMYIELK